MNPFILQPADIFNTSGDEIQSYLIKFGEAKFGHKWGCVNHSGVISGSGTIQTASAVEALITVKEHTLWSEYGPPDDTLVEIWRPIGLLNDDRMAVAQKARSYIGREYGWFKILGHALDYFLGGRYVFRRLTNNDNYPICSWITEHAFKVVNWDFDVPLGSTQPEHIHDYCKAHPEKWECIFPLRRLQTNP